MDRFASMLQSNSLSAADQRSPWRPLLFGCLEAALLALVFAAYGSAPPPDVNEAHYLGKAKHFWDSSWCAGDLFLESAEAHWAFYIAFGWLSQFLSLTAMAWTGRAIVWIGLALSWTYLARGVSTVVGSALASGILWLLLLHHGHLSGEWVVGGIEAKGPAFVLMFFGLGFAIRNRWIAAWWLMGAAAAFHVLVGGWTLIVSLPAWWFTTGRTLTRIEIVKQLAWGLVGAALLSIAGLLPVFRLESQVDEQTLAIARFTYVYGRLPHHLVFSQFDPVRMLSFAALLMLWVMLGSSVKRTTPLSILHLVTAGSMALVAIGIGLDLAAQYQWLSLEQSASLLRFYWFREADVLLPLVVSLCAAAGSASWRAWPKPIQIASIPASFGLLVLLAGTIALQNGDGRPRADQQSLPTDPDRASASEILDDWKQMGEWFKTETPVGSLVITLREQQTFKWYAERGEVVTWKDVPQDAAGLVAWLERNSLIYQEAYDRNQQAGVGLGLLIFTDQALRDLGQKYGANYLVVTRYQMFMRSQVSEPSELKIVYPAPTESGDYAPSYFVVLELDSK